MAAEIAPGQQKATEPVATEVVAKAEGQVTDPVETAKEATFSPTATGAQSGCAGCPRDYNI